MKPKTNTVEEMAVLHITRGGVAYIIKASATFMEVEGEYILFDRFHVVPKLPFDLTPQDRRAIIDALYDMSDKRKEKQNVESK